MNSKKNLTSPSSRAAEPGGGRTIEPGFPLMFNRPGPIDALEVYEQLYGQGVRVFHVDATCSEDIYQPALRAWVSPDRFDYSPQEAGWEALVRRCPDARFCFRLYVASPPWWDEAYPEELQRYPGDRAEHAFLWTARRSITSLASERWMEDAEVALCRFLAWLESSGWCRCVWGLHLSYGITWEWGILGSDDFPDYSEPMRRRFRAWLEETYRSADALQKAWSRPGLTFEDAGIPRPVERLLADGDFRVFPRDRPAYDFQRCLSDANADYLHRLAR
ncbi:MAG: beta-galactosidase, partial [Armatimonadetes bacterium]|nr:beta-galactosidase [Armatimonadota bacterium]